MTPPPTLSQLSPQPRRSRLAIASLVLALCAAFIFVMFVVLLVHVSNAAVAMNLVCVWCLFAMASAISAIAALVVIRKSAGQLIGKGIAVTCLAHASLVALMMFPSPLPINSLPRSRCLPCASNLIQLFKIVENYRRDADGHYPPSLSCLYPAYVTDLRRFQCPATSPHRIEGTYDERLCSYRYIYYPDDSVQKAGMYRLILAFDKGCNHLVERANGEGGIRREQGMNVVFLDGHIEFKQRETLIVELNQIVNCTTLSVAARDSVRKTLQEVMSEGSHK